MEFSKFPELPTELRLIIWRFCLPNRVVEVDMFDEAGMLEAHDEWAEDFYGCMWIHASRANAAPPVLSRVCRESRGVALEHGGLLADDDQLDISRFPPQAAKIWLDRRRDTVYTHCGNKQLSIPLWLAAAGRSQRQPSLRRYSLYVKMTDKEYQSVMIHRNLTIVFQTISIHAPLKSAKDSGLFGLLGEERAVLVDANDTERKKQYWSFWEQHGRRPDPIGAKLLALTCEGKAWVGTHVRRLRNFMFIKRWAKFKGSLPNPESVWRGDPRSPD